MSNFLFVPSPDAVHNLRAEGAPPESIHLVDNVMIDTPLANLGRGGGRRVSPGSASPSPDREASRGQAGASGRHCHRPSRIPRPRRPRGRRLAGNDRLWRGMRDQTERPITVTEGTNTVVGRDPERIMAAAREPSTTTPPGRPALWDGRADERIADVLASEAGRASLSQRRAAYGEGTGRHGTCRWHPSPSRRHTRTSPSAGG